MKYFFIFLLIFPLIWYLFFQSTKHICFEKHRILSDREFIEPDLKAGIESGEILIHSWDNTVDSYLKHHPNCCGVSKNTNWYFDGEILVSLEYELSERRKKELGGHATHHTYISAKDACGKHYQSMSMDE